MRPTHVFRIQQRGPSTHYEKVMNAVLSDDFFQKNIQDTSKVQLRAPFDRCLGAFHFNVSSKFLKKRVIHIQLSADEFASNYPFTVLNSSLCENLLDEIKFYENRAPTDTQIILSGTGRSFLVGPQISFLSKVCIGGKHIVLPAETNVSDSESVKEKISMSMREEDYEKVFQSFLKLFAALNFSSEKAFVEAVEDFGDDSVNDTYQNYLRAYKEALLSNMPSHFLRSRVITGVNGIAFGIGTHIAKSGHQIFGNSAATWDEYKVCEGQISEQSYDPPDKERKSLHFVSAQELQDRGDLKAILSDKNDIAKQIMSYVHK